MRHEYLGDGVYASFDGHHIWLRVGSHDAQAGIALEPEVFAALLRYRERVRNEPPELAEKLTAAELRCLHGLTAKGAEWNVGELTVSAVRKLLVKAGLT